MMMMMAGDSTPVRANKDDREQKKTPVATLLKKKMDKGNE